MKIHWHLNGETRYPFGEHGPDPQWFEPIGFPPPWPDRPWIFGVMVASANGVVAWKRRGPHDDPVAAVLGGDECRAERVADRYHMRHLRCYGDVSIGAGTFREQPDLVPLPQEPGEPSVPTLYEFRRRHGLPREPRVVVYSLYGRLDPRMAVFRTPGVKAIVAGTPIAEAALAARGVRERGVSFVSEDVHTPDGLRRAHERLAFDYGVRYLACEGGATMLAALRRAGLLDEVFVTSTDAAIDEAAHEGVLKIMDFESEGASLIAEGRIAPESGWRFRRWRFNDR